MASFDFDRDLRWIDPRPSARVRLSTFPRQLNETARTRTNGAVNELLGVVSDVTSLRTSTSSTLLSFASERHYSVGVNMDGPGHHWPDWTVYSVTASAFSTSSSVRPNLFVQYIGSASLTDHFEGDFGFGTIYLRRSNSFSLNYDTTQIAFSATHDDDRANPYPLVFGISFANLSSSTVNAHVYYSLSVQRLTNPPPPVFTAVR